MNATTRLRGATRAPTCKWCTRFPVPCRVGFATCVYPELPVHAWIDYGWGEETAASACGLAYVFGGPLPCLISTPIGSLSSALYAHRQPVGSSNPTSSLRALLVSSSPSCCAIPTFAPPRPQVRDDHQQLRAPAGGVPQLPAEPRASRSRGARSGGGVRRRGGSLLAAQHLAADAQVVHGRRPALRPRERRPFAGGGTSRREEEILMCYMLLCAVCCNA